MRKLFFTAGLATLLIASCAKEQVEKTVDNVTYVTASSVSDASTKTYMDENNNIIWHKNDNFAVFSSLTPGATKYMANSPELSNEGKTGKFQIANLPESSEYYAVYPDDGSNVAVNADGKLQVSIKRYQSAAYQSFNNFMNVAVAKAGADKVFHFHNLCALIRIDIFTNDIRKIEFKGRNSEKVSGTFAVNFDGDKPVMVQENTSNSDPITIQGPFMAGQSYYIVVPARDYQRGFDLWCQRNSGTYFGIYPEKPITLQPGHIYPIAVVSPGYSLKKQDGTLVSMLSQSFRDDNVYARKLHLEAGDYVVSAPGSKYVVPANSPLNQEVTYTLGTDNTAATLHIDQAGTYRLVVDGTKSTVILYDEAHDLKPKKITFYPEDSKGNRIGGSATEEVTTLLARGDGKYWNPQPDLALIPSEDDPQVLVYLGNICRMRTSQPEAFLSGKKQFNISGGGTTDEGKAYNWVRNYTLCPPLVGGTRVTSTVTFNTWLDMDGGSDAEHRESYFAFGGNKVNYIVFDLRNMKVKFQVLSL